ncbi:MAG: hypothetical protein LBL86_05085 [Coriobacteriales bacterium]|nr:hypothetical protein [Coriobacteriales bacterium]
MRNGFADFLDDARTRPRYLKRRKSHYVLMTSDDFDRLVSEDIDVKTVADDDGGHYTESRALPDVIGFGATREDALRSFEEGAVSFAYEYYDNYALYSASPGRSGQAALITKILSHNERFGSIADLIKVS